MQNYEEVEKMAKRVETIYSKLSSIGAEESSLMAKPPVHYNIPDIIVDSAEHNSTLMDLYEQWSVDDRLRVIWKQRDELLESLKQLKDTLYRNLIPNHWYVFNRIAVMNVVWTNNQGYVSWRIDIEQFDDREKYIKFNRHNMEPLVVSSDKFNVMDTYEWFKRVGKGTV